jgi:hypothetical protein
MTMFALFAILFSLCIKEKIAEERKPNEDDENTMTKYTSGYDYYRNVYWELEQKYKIID